MKTFKFKILRQIFEIILVGTMLPTLVVVMILYVFPYNDYGWKVGLIYLGPWLFINGFLISSLSGTLVVTPNKMTRKMSGFVLSVKFKDIHKIQFKKYKKNIIFYATEDKNLNINSNYRDYQHLYRLVVLYLIQHDKSDIIPTELMEYLKEIN